MKALPEKCFAGLKKLKKVTSAGTIEVIGEKAFENCTALEIIPSLVNVERVDENVFEGCTKLKKPQTEGTEKREAEKSEKISYGVGNSVFFGEYPQRSTNPVEKQPMEWIVLEEQEDKVLLLSKCILDTKVWNSDSRAYDPIWTFSTLREWLHTQFKDVAFSEKEQKKLVKTNEERCIACTDSSYFNPYNPDELPCYISNFASCKGVGRTRDWIFLLSAKQVQKYAKASDDLWSAIFLAEGTPYAFSLGLDSMVKDYDWELDEDSIQLGFNEKNGPWFLRTYGELYPHTVSWDEIDDCYGVKETGVGIRPALWMKK